jgi:hypothetical protein
VWTFVFDAEARCKHVNLIKKRDGAGKLADETEFLLPPYSAFEVLQVALSSGAVTDPHRITLRVASNSHDTGTWSEELPSAPWL